MNRRLASVIGAVYDAERREVLGRDGLRWAKLGLFYFFFYLALAMFFFAMIGVFMAVTPRDRPRYYGSSSSMHSRVTHVSPGLGFRPQIDSEKNLVFVDKSDPTSPYATNLDHYLSAHYPHQHDNSTHRFVIEDPGDCQSDSRYGFSKGQPCVLVKMNKIISFRPEPGYKSADRHAFEETGCELHPNAVSIHCYGEYPADADNIGDMTYVSEHGHDDRCGTLDTKWFPYEGKDHRRNIYQAPYIWVQFNHPAPNVLIDVVCRVYARNVEFDKVRAQASTRFQIYVRDLPQRSSSRDIAEF